MRQFRVQSQLHLVASLALPALHVEHAAGGECDGSDQEDAASDQRPIERSLRRARLPRARWLFSVRHHGEWSVRLLCAGCGRQRYL